MMSWSGLSDDQVEVSREGAAAKSHKPTKVRANIGQSNDTVLINLGCETDSLGKTHGWAVMVDEGTDWCVVKYLVNVRTAGELYRICEEGWIDLAGSADTSQMARESSSIPDSRFLLHGSFSMTPSAWFPLHGVSSGLVLSDFSSMISVHDAST